MDSTELVDDEDKNESKKVSTPKKLDVQQFIGQCLIKNVISSVSSSPDTDHTRALKHQARLLTGAPLIKGPSKSHNGRVIPQSSQTGAAAPTYPAHPHYLAMVQQHQLSCYYLYLQHQQQLLQSGKSSEIDEEEDEDDDDDEEDVTEDDCFVPRVLKPRRRRKQQQQDRKRSDGFTKLVKEESVGGGHHHHQLEIAYEDELHFLPTDLLTDEARLSGDDGDGGNSSNNNNKSSVIARPSTGKPQLRHSESLQMSSREVLDDINKNNNNDDDSPMYCSSSVSHLQLRKTFSWASSSSGNNYFFPPSDQQQQQQHFSLFPKSSDSDLLSGVRSNLVMGGGGSLETSSSSFRKSSTTSDLLVMGSSNLEEALKSLKIDETSSISRKF